MALNHVGVQLFTRQRAAYNKLCFSCRICQGVVTLQHLPIFFKGEQFVLANCRQKLCHMLSLGWYLSWNNQCKGFTMDHHTSTQQSLGKQIGSQLLKKYDLPFIGRWAENATLMKTWKLFCSYLKTVLCNQREDNISIC